MTAFLASVFSLLLGLYLGSALRAWADADRATEGHKVYP